MNKIWIYVLMIQLVSAAGHPVQDTANIQTPSRMYSTYFSSNDENLQNYNDEKVISVRITSSVAVERGNGKAIQRTSDNNESKQEHISSSTMATEDTYEINASTNDLPPTLRGANIEFIKQLNAKKGTKLLNKHNDQYESFPTNPSYDKQSYSNTRISETNNDEMKHTNDKNIPSTGQILLSNEFVEFKSRSTSVLEEALKLSDERYNPNDTNHDMYSERNPATEEYLTTSFDETEFSDDEKSFSNLDYKKESKEIDDSVAESSIKSILEIVNKHSEDYENIENVPLARSLAHSPSSKNYIQGLNNKPPSERESSTRLTTVSFNILHDAPKMSGYEDSGKPYRRPSQSFQGQQKFYDNPTIYSRPAQIYSEPAKYYSEPAKIYSEPAKIYSEPSKIYSEPAKVYSEPAKFYSEPASLHLKPERPTDYFSWLQPSSAPSSTTLNTTPVAITSPDFTNTQPDAQQKAEKNYEVDEKDSVLTDGRSHGVQESTTEKCKQDNCKVGYVVKGRTFNKYRVEERTSDGFIVGEYGVVRNEDGALRGVRYTADSEASPRLIYDTLMKFLQLK